MYNKNANIERKLLIRDIGRAGMKQIKSQEEKKTVGAAAVSGALSSIYTGVFSIHLLDDTYEIIHSPKSILSMLNGIVSAQRAMNYSIQNTVSKEELLDVLTFVNLTTLPDRMRSEKCLNIDYKGTISGWVRGSFIEVERDEEGNVIQVLYTYQVIDGEKRKELEYHNDFTNVVMEQLT